MSILFEQMPKEVFSEETHSSKVEYERIVILLCLSEDNDGNKMVRKITDLEIQLCEHSYFVLSNLFVLLTRLSLKRSFHSKKNARTKK